jgi:hypothetical protein
VKASYGPPPKKSYGAPKKAKKPKASYGAPPTKSYGAPAVKSSYGAPVKGNKQKKKKGGKGKGGRSPTFLPAPKAHHKPPIIIYQGVKPPVHVYAVTEAPQQLAPVQSNDLGYSSFGSGGQHHGDSHGHSSSSHSHGDAGGLSHHGGDSYSAAAAGYHLTSL